MTEETTLFLHNGKIWSVLGKYISQSIQFTNLVILGNIYINVLCTSQCIQFSYCGQYKYMYCVLLNVLSLVIVDDINM